MSELRVEKLVMPAADLGPENPLPPLKSGRDVHVVKDPIPGIPEDMLQNMTFGRVPNIMPYTMQDGYNRHRERRAFDVAVLENEVLRATFLLGLGGRLWSLVHKPTGRELLDRNPVFQPANLALRNAWFSGGVEWNIGTTGHSPFTCSPLFAARVALPDGTPVLRLYEWERIRRVPFQIDAYLPDGSDLLFVCVRIVNPHDETVPMYWWSNIAVTETPETRVVVPASSAYSFGYGGRGLARVSIPEVSGVDVTYPTNIGRAADFFFHVPEGQRPWISALDEQGEGLVQCSTPRLKGRKLFLWGMGDGGRRWQSFLAEPGHAYIEIQAGLARTQLEHLPMPAKTAWVWLEAYGLMEADPSKVHGPRWEAAVEDVDRRLEALISRQELQAELDRYAPNLDRPPQSLIQRGSGWGTLEAMRQAAAGEVSFVPDGLIYDRASLDERQAPWATLLRTGRFPNADPLAAPKGYMVQPEWSELLEASLEAGHDNWLSRLHLGIMRYQQGQRDAAREAWGRSLALDRNPWAARNLAVLAWEEERYADATALYSQALRMRPALLPLAIEAGRRLVDMGQSSAWLELLEELPPPVRSAGRIRLLEGQAALEAGALERVAALFDGSLVVEDLREGERSLSELWFEYHTHRISQEEDLPIDESLRSRVRTSYPVPEFLDFRMSSGDA